MSGDICKYISAVNWGVPFGGSGTAMVLARIWLGFRSVVRRGE